LLLLFSLFRLSFLILFHNIHSLLRIPPFVFVFRSVSRFIQEYAFFYLCNVPILSKHRKRIWNYKHIQ
jgi:hypothetical protein